MTVSVAPAYAGPFTGNDSASSFPFEFKVFADSDIRVIETTISTATDTDLVLNGANGYTVSRNNDQDANPGGTITYKQSSVTTALPSGKKLTIVGDFTYEQPTDVPNGGSFFGNIIEKALDRITMFVKQLKQEVDSALRMTPTVDPDTYDPTIPAPEHGMSFAWELGDDGIYRLVSQDADSLINIEAAENRIVETFTSVTDYTAGTTDTLTLDALPGAEGNVSVYFDGIWQMHDTFSVSLYDVVFDDPIPLGTLKVEVAYTKTFNVNVVESENVSFTPAGSGAVTSNVRNKLREIISVKDFGAVGNGIADDSAAIQAAIAHAATIAGSGAWTGTGVGVFFPDGVYLCNSSIVVATSGIGLFGHPSRGAKLTTPNNIELLVLGDSTDAASVLELHVHHLFLECSATGNTATGIAMYRAVSGSIDNCTLRSFDHQIRGYRENRMQIRNCNFNANRTTKGSAHIRLAGSALGNGGGVHITDCELGGSGALLPDYTAAIWIDSIDGLYVNNCHTRDSDYGLYVAPDGVTAGRTDVIDIMVTQTYFDEVYDRAVYLTGTVNAGSVYQSIRFVGCRFRCGNGGVADAGDHCLDVSITDGGTFDGAVRDIQVIGGIMSRSYETAIRILGTAGGKVEVAGVTISNVFFEKNNENGNVTSNIFAECGAVTILGNTFMPDTTAGDWNVRLTASSVDPDTSSIIAANNNFANSNCTLTPISIGTVSVGAAISVNDNMHPGHGKQERNLYKCVTDSRSPVIIWSKLIDSAGQAGAVSTRTVGVQTNATAGTERVVYENRTAFYRQNGGNATLNGNTAVYAYTTTTGSGNNAPVTLSRLDGTAHSNGAVVAAGAMITGSGNVYLVLNPGTLGASAPSHTSGVAANGTADLGYVSIIAEHTLALIVAGVTGVDMSWAAEINYIAVP